MERKKKINALSFFFSPENTQLVSDRQVKGIIFQKRVPEDVLLINQIK